MRKLLLLATVCGLFAGPSLSAEPLIDPVRLAEHVKILASDEYEGRAPVSPGETKTVAYLEAQFKAVGLQPAGDPLPGGGRAWTQAVPLAKFEASGPVTTSFGAGGETRVLVQGEQIAIRAPQTGIEQLAVKDAPVVFIGYGVKAPERDWDDFKGVDLKGKVALVLVNDPDFETGVGDFGGKAMTYYGRWTYKFEEAARQGAIGFLVIHETAPAAYGWATVKNSNTNAIFDIIRADPAKAHAPLEGWVQRDVAVDMFQKAGLDFEALKRQAQTREFKPTPLTGVTLSVEMPVKVEKVVSNNVIGVLFGKVRPEERIIYTAHWDHLGVGAPDAKGDTIYNGAVDNADGIAAMIELGRAFGRAPPTDRSVLFLAVTAEERGLLGSEYYAANPLYPLASTVAILNMDALKVAGPARDVSTSGDGGVTLTDDLIRIAKAHGRGFTPDQNPAAGSFFRSDHFSFAKQGVPAISFKSGEDLMVGGKAAGKSAADAYTRDRYHQPADEYDDSWNLEGVAQEVAILYDLGRDLANSTAWPQWKEGSEFKALRDATAAERR